MLIILNGCGFVGSNFKSRIQVSKYICVHLEEQSRPLNENCVIAQDLEVFIHNSYKIYVIDLYTPNKLLISNMILGENEEIYIHKWKSVVDFLHRYEIVKYIMVSSSSIYPFHGELHLHTEECPISDETLYSRVKHFQESYLTNLDHSEIKILRLPNVYGPFDRYSNSLVAKILKSKDSSVQITLLKGAYRDYLYVEDFCDLLESVLQNSHGGKVLNVGTSIATDAPALVEIFEEATGWKPNVEIRQAINTSNNTVANSETLKLYNWSPTIFLSQGISLLNNSNESV